MSQQANELDNHQRLTSVSHGKRPKSSTQNSSLQHPADGGVYWPNEVQMSGSNASGELEGSTLGTSSRDGDRGSREQQHRTQNSGGFFLDSTSLPRTRSSRAGHHRRPHDSRADHPVSGKRSATDSSSALPKKKSRFPWSRQRHAAESSHPLATNSSHGAGYQERVLTTSTPSDTQEQGAGVNTSRGSALGLDDDSANIVNLALNLNESRKSGALGRPNLGQISGGIAGVSAQSASTGNFAPRRQASALSQLSGADEGDYLPIQYSDATLQRAEKTRLHFELFYQYLRLLRLLPPLRPPVTDDTSDFTDVSSNFKHGNRAYNPLQSIRNRKVRLREKSAIDPETDGWDDIDRVRKWIDTVEDQYDQHGRDSAECLRLPPFRKGNQRVQAVQAEPKTVDMFPASPPTSLRRVSHASSGLKWRRPRLDWMISPAELLADAAWVEEKFNKGKIVDNEGNTLYPDPEELVPADGDVDYPNFSEPRGRRSTNSRRSLSLGFREIERGRPRYRSRSPSQFNSHSSSMSKRGRKAKGREIRARSSISSSVSSHNIDEVKREPWNYRARLANQEVSGSAQAPFLKEPEGNIVNQQKVGLAQDLSPPRLSSNIHRHKAKTDVKADSVSSVPSTDGKYNIRTPENTIDGSGARSPSRVSCFPSITVDLSPPSSRSPSPTKRHLPRVIGTIRDRSASKHRKRISREDPDNEPFASESISKRSTGGTLEPPESAASHDTGRVPDHPSWSFGEDQRTDDSPFTDSPRAQKGPLHPESRLRRGIYKGRGRIAEIVGNEVSKVGDFLKKDPTSHNRKPSNAPSLSSNDSGLDESEAAKSDLKSSFLRRLATSSDDGGPLGGPNLDKQSSKNFISNLPNFTPSPKRAGQVERGEASDADIINEQVTPSNVDSARRVPTKSTDSSASPQIKFETPTPSRIPPEKQSNRLALRNSRGGNSKGAFFPASPPVTGLAKAEASTVPSSSQKKRRSFADASRSWSISDRSISISANLGLPEKSEIERTRALLLCSGIKAREITRRAQIVRCPPPDFLLRSVADPADIPRITRVDEHEYAVKNLVRSFERSSISLHQSMDRFSTAICPSLESQLKDLEILIDQSLSGRVRETSTEADNLNVQLSTTATLAVKQLSDILDRAARGRHRRFRWLHGASFSLLEWTLVTAMWLVWLIVMVFKVVRGIFRGAVSGVRWILWF